MPYVFALPRLTSGRPIPEPAAPWARSGRFAMDTMTLIAPGTYDAARGAVDAALTACDLVLDGGSRAAYAATRPPVTTPARRCTAAPATSTTPRSPPQYLRDRGAERVAIIDIDAHHGNGTQEIFYARDDVFFGSVHVDPAAGWFPHFLGFADERGADAGAGFNRNLPVAPGTADDDWVVAVHDLTEEARRSGRARWSSSLGVDAAAADPESPLKITESGFAPRRTRPRRRSRFPPSSCRKAATTSTTSARSCSRSCAASSPDVHLGSTGWNDRLISS